MKRRVLGVLAACVSVLAAVALVGCGSGGRPIPESSVLFSKQLDLPVQRAALSEQGDQALLWIGEDDSQPQVVLLDSEGNELSRFGGAEVHGWRLPGGNVFPRADTMPGQDSANANNTAILRGDEWDVCVTDLDDHILGGSDVSADGAQFLTDDSFIVWTSALVRTYGLAGDTRWEWKAPESVAAVSVARKAATALVTTSGGGSGGMHMYLLNSAGTLLADQTVGSHAIVSTDGSRAVTFENKSPGKSDAALTFWDVSLQKQATCKATIPDTNVSISEGGQVVAYVYFGDQETYAVAYASSGRLLWKEPGCRYVSLSGDGERALLWSGQDVKLVKTFGSGK